MFASVHNLLPTQAVHSLLTKSSKCEICGLQTTINQSWPWNLLQKLINPSFLANIHWLQHRCLIYIWVADYLILGNRLNLRYAQLWQTGWLLLVTIEFTHRPLLQIWHHIADNILWLDSNLSCPRGQFCLENLMLCSLIYPTLECENMGCRPHLTNP